MKKLHKFPASYIKFLDKLIQLLFSELQTTTTTTIIRHELGLDRPISASSKSLWAAHPHQEPGLKKE